MIVFHCIYIVLNAISIGTCWENQFSSLYSLNLHNRCNSEVTAANGSNYCNGLTSFTRSIGVRSKELKCETAIIYALAICCKHILLQTVGCRETQTVKLYNLFVIHINVYANTLIAKLPLHHCRFQSDITTIGHVKTSYIWDGTGYNKKIKYSI